MSRFLVAEAEKMRKKILLRFFYSTITFLDMNKKGDSIIFSIAIFFLFVRVCDSPCWRLICPKMGAASQPCIQKKLDGCVCVTTYVWMTEWKESEKRRREKGSE